MTESPRPPSQLLLETVAVIGPGAMCRPIARNLDAGVRDVGFDPSPQARSAAEGLVLTIADDWDGCRCRRLGGSQRTTAALFELGITNIADDGHPVVVLLDEVEALGVNRRTAASSTNPVGVHRATAAFLTGVDRVADQCRNVLSLATMNDMGGVDDAFLSRADLTEHFGLPSNEAIRDIFADALRELSFDVNGKECADREMDARRVRELVLQALINGGPELAMAPTGLRLEHVPEALMP